MKRGFTLIELLIAASIFASVLAMAFITMSTVMRSIRQSESTRSVAANGFDLTSTIALYVRYASPVYDAQLNRPCSISPTASPLRQAAHNGLSITTDNASAFISVPATETGDVNRIYGFQEQYQSTTGGFEQYQVYMSIYEALTINDTVADCGYVQVGQQYPLLGANTFIEWPSNIATPPRGIPPLIFYLYELSPRYNGDLGEVSLDPDKIGETTMFFLAMRLTVVTRDPVTGAIAQTRAFATAATPRLYESSFSSL